MSVVRAITKMDGEKLGRNTLKVCFQLAYDCSITNRMDPSVDPVTHGKIAGFGPRIRNLNAVIANDQPALGETGIQS